MDQYPGFPAPDFAPQPGPMGMPPMGPQRRPPKTGTLSPIAEALIGAARGQMPAPVAPPKPYKPTQPQPDEGQLKLLQDAMLAFGRP